MSKQNINIGAAIDDGTGDYMRKGGIKINSNFDEIYNNLGDSENIHASGYWQTFSPIDNSDNVLNLKFGDQIILDASNIDIMAYLPNASAPTDVGKTIKIRDAFKTWGYGTGFNIVTVQRVLGSNNTIKTSTAPAVFSEPYKDIEFVYTAENDWQYVDSTYIDRISNANRAIDNSIEFAASISPDPSGLYQWDLNTNHEGYIYNTETVSVYRKGNLLSRGVDSTTGFPTINSDYGSIPTVDNPSVIVTTADGDVDLGVARLDGKTIKLVQPANENDTIIIKSLLDNPDTYTSTYTSKSFIITDISALSEFDKQSTVALDLENLQSVTLKELGLPIDAWFNPGSLKVSINGKLLVGESFIEYDEYANNPIKSWDYTVERSRVDLNNDGDIGDPSTGASADDSSESNLWFYNTIIFADIGYLKDGDVLTLEWFMNNAGSNLSWEGPGGIDELVSDNYLKSDEYFRVSNKLQYSDTSKPSATTAIIDNASLMTRISNVGEFFDLIYPVGTIYENANNPYNPETYMGFGKWVPYAEGKTTIGYSTDVSSIFHTNPQTGTPIGGGLYGDEGVMIQSENIPSIKTDQSAMVKANKNTATVTINTGCLLDPTDTADTTYLDTTSLTINSTGQSQQELSVLQPSITVYKWVRVE